MDTNDGATYRITIKTFFFSFSTYLLRIHVFQYEICVVLISCLQTLTPQCGIQFCCFNLLPFCSDLCLSMLLVCFFSPFLLWNTSPHPRHRLPCFPCKTFRLEDYLGSVSSSEWMCCTSAVHLTLAAARHCRSPLRWGEGELVDS